MEDSSPCASCRNPLAPTDGFCSICGTPAGRGGDLPLATSIQRSLIRVPWSLAVVLVLGVASLWLGPRSSVGEEVASAAETTADAAQRLIAEEVQNQQELLRQALGEAAAERASFEQEIQQLREALVARDTLAARDGVMSGPEPAASTPRQPETIPESQRTPPPTVDQQPPAAVVGSGTLALIVLPFADVYVGNVLRVEARSRVSLTLPAGRHSLRLVRDGYFTVDTTFEIRADESTPVRASLRPRN